MRGLIARSGTASRGARMLFALCALLVASGCSTFSGRGSERERPDTTAKRGGYYLDDGPGERPLPHPDEIGDAVPRFEPLHRGAARPYTVMGRSYAPMTRLAPYRERGLATWYGRRYHGQPTSSGEIYDMYALTAAHTVLPIPSYARVTNLSNQRSVIVRINDRGPFVGERLIDLSYVAAHKLDILRGGSALVEVEAILPETWAAEATPPRPLARAPHATPAASRAPLLPRGAESESATPPPAAFNAATSAVGSDADAPAAAATPAYHLQLGAYAQRENAERQAERLRAQLIALGASVAVVNSDRLHRLHAGPYPSREAALQAADAIGQMLGVAPVLVLR